MVDCSDDTVVEPEDRSTLMLVVNWKLY